MNQLEIDLAFWEAIQTRGVSQKLSNISEDKVYNWRKKRGPKPTLGDMLEVLFELNIILIKKVE